MAFEHYNLFTRMIFVLLVNAFRSLFANSQSAFLKDFNARECIQLVFTTS